MTYMYTCSGQWNAVKGYEVSLLWACYHKEWIWILLLLHAYYSSKQLCIPIHIPVYINKELPKKKKKYGLLKACWNALYSDLSNKSILLRFFLHVHECIFTSWSFLRLLPAQDQVIFSFIYSMNISIFIHYLFTSFSLSLWKLLFAWILFYKVINMCWSFEDKG